MAGAILIGERVLNTKPATQERESLFIVRKPMLVVEFARIHVNCTRGSTSWEAYDPLEGLIGLPRG
jgi:hypothetical protein